MAWTRALTPVLAFGGLLYGVWRGAPSWLDVPAPKPVVIGYIDMRSGQPSLFATEGGELEVSGWTVCDNGSSLRSVAILIDGEKRVEVKDFFLRRDVAVTYGRADFARSGWRTSVPLSGVAAGDHVLGARGQCSRGGEGLLPAFRLTILQ